MNKKLQEILNNLSKENLIDIVGALHANMNSQKLVEQQIAAFDPKELKKILNKQVTALKRGSRFIDYYAAMGLAEEIEQINDGIAKLLKQNAANLALELCQKLIAIDEKIYERTDDSSGAISQSYYQTQELLDQAFCDTETPPEQVADYIFDACMNDDYGIRGYVLHHCKRALKQGADKPLEQRVLKELTPESHWYFSIRLVIADARSNVDDYIRIEQEHWQHIGHEMGDQTILEIAKRLNNAFRGDEAIAWLEKINGGHHQYEKIELLIEAYQLEGMNSKAQALLWQRFEKNLSAHDYLRYLKNASAEQRQTAKTKAIEFSKRHDCLSSAINFLYEVQEFDLLDTLVLGNMEQLDGGDYSSLRKISTSLSQYNKNLAATLIRRTLVWDTLNKAQSKYYKYGVSDLKKATDFAEKVSDWKEFDSHAKFLKDLKETHYRKMAFWSQVNPET